jgi:hypothetical protein
MTDKKENEEGYRTPVDETDERYIMLHRWNRIKRRKANKQKWEELAKDSQDRINNNDFLK